MFSTGFHCALVRKRKPSPNNTSRPPHNVDSAAPSSEASTSRAQNRNTPRNQASLRASMRLRRWPGSMMSVAFDMRVLWRVGTPQSGGVPSYVMPIRSVLELRLPVSLDLLDQRFGQGHVVEFLRLCLTMFQRPFEEV